MARVKANVIINRPVQDVFGFLSVAENHARFIPGMLEFHQVSPGTMAQVGAKMRGVRRFLGRKTELPYEVTGYESPRLLAMQGSMGPLTFKYGYVLEPKGDGTSVTFWLEPSLQGLARVGQPFIVLISQTHALETLANLKKVLESQAA